MSHLSYLANRRIKNSWNFQEYLEAQITLFTFSWEEFDFRHQRVKKEFINATLWIFALFCLPENINYDFHTVQCYLCRIPISDQNASCKFPYLCRHQMLVDWVAIDVICIKKHIAQNERSTFHFLARRKADGVRNTKFLNPHFKIRHAAIYTTFKIAVYKKRKKANK